MSKRLKSLNSHKLILIIAVFLCIGTYVQAANYVIENITTGWTGSVKFHTTQDVNLTTNPIQFELTNNATVTSIWGLDGKLNFTQTGNTVSVKVTKNWPEGADYILKANNSVTLSFSPSIDNFSINNFRIGNSSTEGTVTLKKDSTSAPIPANTIVKLTPEDSTNGMTYTFKWSAPKTHRVEYGNYNISAYINNTKLNNTVSNISVYPPNIFLDESQPSALVALQYTDNKYSINLALQADKPEGASNTLPVNIINIDTQAPVTVNIPWNESKVFTTDTPGVYTFKATPITGFEITKFKFNPTTIETIQGQEVPVSISSYTQPLPSKKVKINISGLPHDTDVNLYFKNDYTPQEFKNITNGSKITISEGNYILTSTPVTIEAVKYASSPKAIKVAFSTSEIDISYTKVVPHETPKVKGWPTNNITMGSIAEGTQNVFNYNLLQTRLLCVPTEAIFTYAVGGGGDTYSLNKYTPTKTTNLMNMARELETKTGKHIMPVVVAYTSGGSSSTTAMDIDFGLDKTYPNNLWMRFYNLIKITKKIQSYKDAEHPNPATILLNPDFIGELHKIQTGAAWAPFSFTTNQIPLQTAITKAYSELGIALPKLPQFVTNNGTIPDYLLTVNWLISINAPDVPFGWMDNIWAGKAEGHKWIHKPSELKTNINNEINFLNGMNTYKDNFIDGTNIKPDFIAFDKYERDNLGSDSNALNNGYTYNIPAWNTYYSFIKGVSKGIGEERPVPVMLFQLPGGHLQLPSDIDIRDGHGSTAADYLFGDNNLTIGLSNVKDYIKALIFTRPKTDYDFDKSDSVIDYLNYLPTENNDKADWRMGHTDQLKNANVFSILWGGGMTTSLVGLSSDRDDNGWLVNKINKYYDANK